MDACSIEEVDVQRQSYVSPKKSPESERLEFLSSTLPGLIYERHFLSSGQETYPFFGGALLKRLGVTAEQALTNPDSLFSCIHPEDLPKFKDTLATARTSRTGYSLDLRWIDNAGHILWTRNIGMPKERSGETRWMCMSIEVTELKASQESNRSAQCDRLDFMATMSHELRTPLHSLLGYGELMLETSLSPAQLRYATLGQEASRSLLRIANEALEYAGSVGDTIEPTAEVFDVREQLSVIAGGFEPEAAAKGLGMTLRLCPALPNAVLGQKQYLRQILTNIVSNAIKYTDLGTIQMSCDVIGGGEFGMRIRIQVKDTGIGIAEHLVPKLFGRFSQVSQNATRTKGGSGLGLSITKALVAKMGGTIGIQTRENVGTTFTIELIVQPTTLAQIDPYVRPTVLAPKQVLFVDDTVAAVDLVRDFLSGSPISVIAAGSGSEALAIAASAKLDLIFLDLNMPVMCGIETARRLRADVVKGSRTPIVALTGDETQVARQVCRENGFDDFVSKPFSRAQLTGMIEKWA